VNHINKPTRYAANLQTPKTPDSVIALWARGKIEFCNPIEIGVEHKRRSITREISLKR